MFLAVRRRRRQPPARIHSPDGNLEPGPRVCRAVAVTVTCSLETRMSEGFFPPETLTVPHLPSDTLCAAMVRIFPATLLRLDLAPTAEEARDRARNEDLPDGSELWHRFFTPDDLARASDPEFAMGMVRHEFSRLVRAGATFPQTVPLDGGGSGFAITSAGHVLTNYHLVTSEVANHQRELGALHTEVRCRSLRAQVARPSPDGGWQWNDADAVWLVSNPPEARAVVNDARGVAHLREDTALLRVEPAPSAFLPLSTRLPAASEPVWMAGFPLRTAREPEALRKHGYTDADGTLRVSTGRVLEADDDDGLVSDVDGSMGNSGSPLFDGTGQVVGLFSRAAGNGPKNAFSYGHMTRVCVGSRRAIDGLELDRWLAAPR